MINRRDMLQMLGGSALLPLGMSAQAQPAPPAPNATLGAIRAVTQTANSLPDVEQAWTKYLGYRVVSRGKLPAATAVSWGAPDLAGKGYVILGPQSGEPTYVRFVEQVTPAGYDATDTFGWRMIEITVQNSDELYSRLKDSPFIVRGPPRMVPTYSYLKALGATGPAGERLAFTWITETRPDLAVAKSFVGRCFIATQLSPDLPGSLQWFKSRFGNTSSPIRQLPGTALSVVTLQDGAKIEVDQHGPNGKKRERVGKGLPPGLAVVTFSCSDLAKHARDFIAPAAANALEPFPGKTCATMYGNAGELIELVET